ncbi:MAG: ABC transporter permease subunit [Aeromicrobium sp.]
MTGTLTASQESPPDGGPAEAPVAPRAPRRRPGRGLVLGAALGVYIVLAFVLNGRQTLVQGRADLSRFAVWGNDFRDSVDSARSSGSAVMGVLDAISSFLNTVVETLQGLISDAPAGRPVPEIGWLGVVAIAIWIVWTVSGVRMAGLTAVAFGLFGTFGYWEESMDTLIVAFVAVFFIMLLGIPLGLWMGNSRRVTQVVTPVLDVMQTFPAFVYLAPITLFFGIGAAPAVIVTFIYAFPPVVRVTAEGVRQVDSGVLEATHSLGVTTWQRLLNVQLPMARRTIIVGVNQSIMAALSMVTIAAFINSPGLGIPVLTALQSLDVGTAFTAGILIAVMAVWLDRVTTAAGEQTTTIRTVGGTRRRRIAIAVGVVVAGVCVYLSRTYLDLAIFPESPDLGTPVRDASQSVADWFATHASVVTVPIKDAVSTGLLNPFQTLLAESPWWLTAAFLLLLAFLVGGVQAGVISAVCLGAVLAVGIWNEAMVTVATTLVGTVIVVVLALVLGVLMANSRVADLILRPVLDTAQTIPAFVYLIPAIALFDPSRFTAIVAAVIYAAPVAIKLVCDGIRGVSASSIEGAQSAGSSPWQMITKVQLPMARSSIALASNQGLLYVFAVIVIGGLVGAGGLGYYVVAGFSRGELFGKGLAAGIAIVALAVMFDRITQGWVARTSPRRTATT